MYSVNVMDDLVLEVHEGAWLLKLRSVGQAQDGETPPGEVIIFPGELPALIRALEQARDNLLAELKGGEHIKR